MKIRQIECKQTFTNFLDSKIFGAKIRITHKVKIFSVSHLVYFKNLLHLALNKFYKKICEIVFLRLYGISLIQCFPTDFAFWLRHPSVSSIYLELDSMTSTK